MVAFVLVVVGGLNWLAVGLLGMGLDLLTDPISPVLTRVIYVLVGVSAVYLLLTHKATCRSCATANPVTSL